MAFRPIDDDAIAADEPGSAALFRNLDESALYVLAERGPCAAHGYQLSAAWAEDEAPIASGSVVLASVRWACRGPRRWWVHPALCDAQGNGFVKVAVAMTIALPRTPVDPPSVSVGTETPYIDFGVFSAQEFSGRSETAFTDALTSRPAQFKTLTTGATLTQRTFTVPVRAGWNSLFIAFRCHPLVNEFANVEAADFGQGLYTGPLTTSHESAGLANTADFLPIPQWASVVPSLVEGDLVSGISQGYPYLFTVSASGYQDKGPFELSESPGSTQLAGDAAAYHGVSSSALQVFHGDLSIGLFSGWSITSQGIIPTTYLGDGAIRWRQTPGGQLADLAEEIGDLHAARLPCVGFEMALALREEAASYSSALGGAAAFRPMHHRVGWCIEQIPSAFEFPIEWNDASPVEVCRYGYVHRQDALPGQTLALSVSIPWMLAALYAETRPVDYDVEFTVDVINATSGATLVSASTTIARPDSTESAGSRASIWRIIEARMSTQRVFPAADTECSPSTPHWLAGCVPASDVDVWKTTEIQLALTGASAGTAYYVRVSARVDAGSFVARQGDVLVVGDPGVFVISQEV